MYSLILQNEQIEDTELSIKIVFIVLTVQFVLTDFTNHTDYADCMDFSYCQAQLQPQLQLSWAEIATPNLQSIVDHKQ